MIFTKLVNAAGRVVVLPHDVIPLLSKVLDRTLFDVTTLIKDDDEAHRDYVPLIVRGTGRASDTAAGRPAL